MQARMVDLPHGGPAKITMITEAALRVALRAATRAAASQAGRIFVRKLDEGFSIEHERGQTRFVPVPDVLNPSFD